MSTDLNTKGIYFYVYNGTKLPWLLAGAGYPKSFLFLLTMCKVLPYYAYSGEKLVPSVFHLVGSDKRKKKKCSSTVKSVSRNVDVKLLTFH